ncbi:hypothetical protein F4561_000981 [Lipingzhangella halophila]|uniref:Uncharacterized protein n=1 Tax=Lipingzhangella halophila TaxID=1783352 RepID=A0A7W7REW1_9ACTN|nr:hypothetical protein [Lipingzhangella halophila]MBB4930161.1 hypothetical protein [Lipingzhangella halophila]
MHKYRSSTVARSAGILAVLVAVTTGCDGGSDEGGSAAEETPALRTLDPDRPTADPSRSAEPGAEETRSIRQSTQGRVFELNIGVASTSDDEASLSISYDSDPDDEKTEGVEGAAGDSFELDSGYTITIDEIDHERDTAEQAGQGTGTVTVTVTAPE